MKTYYSILIPFVALALSACTSENTTPVASNAQAEEQAATNRIDIPTTVRSNLGITFAKVERREVANTIRVPGAFELQPLARHEYRMTLPGHIDLLVDQYEEVKPGDVLYRFRSPQWPELQQEFFAGVQAIDSATAEIDVAREKITEARARLELMHERLAALASADFRQAELEAQAAELEASIPRLEAERRLAETKLANAKRSREHALHRASAATGIKESDLATEVPHNGRTLPAYESISWIEVRATEAGIVQALQITDGAYVEPPSIVVTTVNPDRVRFRAMGLQSDLPRLVDGATARIVPPRTPGLEINDSLPATLTIGLEAHPDQRTVTLLATPEELRSWTRPGVSAFLEIVTKSTGGVALAIPRSAVVKDGITHVFFRRDPNDPNKAIRVEADMGVSDGRWVAINSGLMLSDEVVLDGAYELKLASEQSGVSQKGGHFHADGTFHEDH
jgi:multidrug efflux pump subunit AcrA (membrane-fusion protein)